MSTTFKKGGMTNGSSSNTSTSRYGSSGTESSQDLFAHRIKYVLWRIATIAAFAGVYITVVAEGYRILIPTLSKKIFTLPFLGFLRQFEDAHRIDLAIVMSVILMFSVVYLWERLLEQFVFNAHERLSIVSHREADTVFAENQFFFLVGVVILVCDGLLFYFGVANLSWGGGFSFTAVIATVAYVCVILTIAHVSNRLRRRAFPEE